MNTHANIKCIPPAPPPLPLVCSNLETTEKHNEINTKSTQHQHDIEIKQLVHKCFQWKWINSEAAIIVSRPIQHISQCGPKCGLVALSMASSASCGEELDTSQLLTTARDLGLSNHGEMFSVDYMLQLVQAVMPSCPSRILSHQLADQGFVARQLASGNVLLVPYDSDRNFGPACLQGHKAHWAVLTGVIVPKKILLNHAITDSNILLLKPGSNAVSMLEECEPVENVLVLALQGKSRHLSAWPLADLLASNQNLKHVDPTKRTGKLKYVMPKGGIKEGLQGRAVFIESVNIKSGY